jgi:hypothetical protein
MREEDSESSVHSILLSVQMARMPNGKSFADVRGLGT